MAPTVPFGWLLVLHAARTMVNNAYIEIFLWSVMADLATGIVKSFTAYAKIKADSSTGLKGLAKHLLIIVIVLTLYPILHVLQFDAISNGVVLFYIAEYAISILENLEVMGFPIPSFLKLRFEKMAEDADKEGDEPTDESKK